ncbi:MAG: PEP-CTERM sorting domain-containing protein, partial [Phycisphaerae bacterium]
SWGHAGDLYMNGHSLTANDINLGWAGSGNIHRTTAAETLTAHNWLNVTEGTQLVMIEGDSAPYLQVVNPNSDGVWAQVTTAATSNVTNQAQIAGTLNLGADMVLSEDFYAGGSGWGFTGQVNMKGHDITARSIIFGWAGAAVTDGKGRFFAGDLNVNEGSTPTVLGGLISNQISIGDASTLIVKQANNQLDGLTLDGSSLSLGGSGLLSLIFDNKEVAGLDWAFRWLGDHATTLEGLHTAGKLTWDGAPALDYQGNPIDVSIFYNDADGYTYVGYTSNIPEPATMTLLAIGAAGVLLRRRRKA